MIKYVCYASPDIFGQNCFKNGNDVGEGLQTKPSSPLKLGKPTWYLNNEEKW